MGFNIKQPYNTKDIDWIINILKLEADAIGGGEDSDLLYRFAHDLGKNRGMFEGAGHYDTY